MMSRITLLALICVAAVAEPALRGAEMMQLDSDRAAKLAYEQQDQMESAMTLDVQKSDEKEETSYHQARTNFMLRNAGHEELVVKFDKGSSEAASSNEVDGDQQRWQEERDIIADVQNAKHEQKNFEGMQTEAEQEVDQGAVGSQQDQARMGDDEEQEIRDNQAEATADQEEMAGEFGKKTYQTTDETDGMDLEEAAEDVATWKDEQIHRHNLLQQHYLKAFDRQDAVSKKNQDDENQNHVTVAKMVGTLPSR